MSHKTLLFVPGNSPGMLMNLDILGADAVLIDLEDAVALSEKDAARDLVEEALTTFSFTTDLYVRINPLDSPYFEEDVRRMAKLPLKGILLAKASVESVKALDERLGEDMEIMALIESALGVECAMAILQASPKVKGVLLGAEDLTLDLGARRTKESGEIAYARSRIVSVARALGLEAVDTPFTDVEDLEGLKKDAKAGKDLGMTGKALISPRHVDVVNRVYQPTAEEIEQALRIGYALKEARDKGLGAFSVDGKMVDAPILRRARNTLIEAKKEGIAHELFD
ncbi:CoA ester lyase [Proteiniclasticum sp. BAD-10]|uniref:CoA ester lyase n=1 Tax=Proteiniclasticum sediminis TaxID=2804028 RepID=A0A941CS06_9CLOT|nr:CoA ester lyase [Proteiniclasticum sediminis]MBR0576258.1 CoA ester lyase [Proteiniclasticum sediminis]